MKAAYMEEDLGFMLTIRTPMGFCDEVLYFLIGDDVTLAVCKARYYKALKHSGSIR